MLTIERLGRIAHAMSMALRVCRGRDHCARALDEEMSHVIDEIDRRTHGSFSLLEARATGKLYRRPRWHGWAKSVHLGYDGLEFIDKEGFHLRYLVEEDLDAMDYEVQPGEGHAK